MKALAGGEPYGRRITDALNQLISGKGNFTGSVTLAANETLTTVNDERCSTSSVVVLTPVTATAGTAYGPGFYITTQKGQFTVTHDSSADTDRRFAYCIKGG